MKVSTVYHDVAHKEVWPHASLSHQQPVILSKVCLTRSRVSHAYMHELFIIMFYIDVCNAVW
jgi:hypothetical protein